MWKEKLDCRCEGRKKGCGGKGGQLSTVGVQEVGERKERDVMAAQGGSKTVLPQINDRLLEVHPEMLICLFIKK